MKPNLSLRANRIFLDVVLLLFISTILLTSPAYGERRPWYANNFVIESGASIEQSPTRPLSFRISVARYRNDQETSIISIEKIYAISYKEQYEKIYGFRLYFYRWEDSRLLWKKTISWEGNIGELKGQSIFESGDVPHWIVPNSLFQRGIFCALGVVVDKEGDRLTGTEIGYIDFCHPNGSGRW